MFKKRKVIKYEAVVNEKFEQYIKKMIKPFEFSETPKLGDQNIKSLEKMRYITTRNGILSLYQTYMMDPSVSILSEDTSINIDISEFEKMICNLNISIINTILQKADIKKRECEKIRFMKNHFRRKVGNIIHNALTEYSENLKNLIKENENYINRLNEGQVPIYNLDRYQLTYKKLN